VLHHELESIDLVIGNSGMNKYALFYQGLDQPRTEQSLHRFGMLCPNSPE
jgi:hypothetical protein